MKKTKKLVTTAICDYVGTYFAYLDENNTPRLAVDRGKVASDNIILLFVATNSFCSFPDADIFDKKNGKLRAGKVFTNSQDAIAFKSVPLSKVPLKPYIK